MGDLLIKAFNKVHMKNPEWKLHIVGYGSELDYLQKIRDDLFLDNAVKFIGYTKDVKSELLNSSIAVMTSEYEGFPMVVLEYLEIGLPIVAFELPPLTEINGDSNVIAFAKQKDIDSLVAKINDLIIDFEKRKQIGVNAKRLSYSYDINCIGEKWKKVFNL